MRFALILITAGIVAAAAAATNAFTDNFDAETAGSLPSTWTVIGSTAASGQQFITVADGSAPSAPNVMLHDNPQNKGYGTARFFPTINLATMLTGGDGALRFQYEIAVSQITLGSTSGNAGFVVQLGKGNGSSFQAGFPGGLRIFSTPGVTTHWALYDGTAGVIAREIPLDTYVTVVAELTPDPGDPTTGTIVFRCEDTYLDTITYNSANIDVNGVRIDSQTGSNPPAGHAFTLDDVRIDTDDAPVSDGILVSDTFDLQSFQTFPLGWTLAAQAAGSGQEWRAEPSGIAASSPNVLAVRNPQNKGFEISRRFPTVDLTTLDGKLQFRYSLNVDTIMDGAVTGNAGFAISMGRRAGSGFATGFPGGSIRVFSMPGNTSEYRLYNGTVLAANIPVMSFNEITVLIEPNSGNPLTGNVLYKMNGSTLGNFAYAASDPLVNGIRTNAQTGTNTPLPLEFALDDLEVSICHSCPEFEVDMAVGVCELAVPSSLQGLAEDIGALADSILDGVQICDDNAPGGGSVANCRQHLIDSVVNP